MSKADDDYLELHKELRELIEERNKMNDREEEIRCRMTNLEEDSHLNWTYLRRCIEEGIAG